MEQREYYDVQVNGEKLESVGAPYAFLPKVATFGPDGLESLESALVFPDEVFTWYGDPDDPPWHCDPVCELGAAAYRRKAERQAGATKSRVAKELDALARRQRVLEAELENERAEAGEAEAAEPSQKPQAAPKARKGGRKPAKRGPRRVRTSASSKQVHTPGQDAEREAPEGSRPDWRRDHDEDGKHADAPSVTHDI